MNNEYAAKKENRNKIVLAALNAIAKAIGGNTQIKNDADGDYDQWGAYWGNSPQDGVIWCAWSDEFVDTTYVFVRAHSRGAAKQQVLEKLPKAKFYR